MEGYNILVCLIVIIPCQTVLSQENSLLLTYGNHTGDKAMNKTDDSFVNVPLAFEFPFFDQNYRLLFLNDNGVISFLKKEIDYTPTAFPLADKRLIAPFWADVDIHVAGDIYYRQEWNTSVLREVDAIIRGAFPVKFSRFRSTWSFIATWEEVAFYNNRPKQFEPINNTFQAVLASDGLHSFTIFNYQKIEWTTGLSSFGDKATGSANSDLSIGAQVGFNAGDGVNFFAVEGSRTQAVKNVTITSNVNFPGRWVFRTDLARIESAGCDDSLSAGLRISQTEVNMLGGDILAVSGPCFLGIRNISVSCRVDGVVTRASYNLTEDHLTVHCVTPVFMRLGEALVELSLDGGQSFTDNITVTIVPLEIQPGLVDVTEENRITKRLTWNTEETPFDLARETVTNVDIILYGYLEDSASQLIELRPIRMLKKNARLANGNALVDESAMLVDGMDVGIVRVVEHGMVDIETDVISWSSTTTKTKRSSGLYDHPDPIPAMWSLPFNTNPISARSASLWCRDWARRAEAVVPLPEDNVADCPCLVSQARGDKGLFEVLPSCLEGGSTKESCILRPDAQICFRTRFASPLEGRGQLCCYDDQGQLVNLKDSVSGGALQSHHHSGFEPDHRVGNVPYFSNLLHDTVPWEECCAKTNELRSCKYYSSLRPSSDCKDYVPPGIASVYGEPHLNSWDIRSYTFNGYGEYQLVATKRLPSRVNIQARMEEVVTGSGATGVTAIAGQFGNLDRVQIEVSQRRDIDVWVYHRGKGKWILPAFAKTNYYFAKGLEVEVYRNTTDRNIRTGALVAFRDGSSIDVRMPNGGRSLNVLVGLSPSLKRTVWGLMGTWDDDSSNDFTTRNGNYISSPSPALLYSSLQNWQLSDGDSILRYPNGKNGSDYEAPSHFVPMGELTTANRGITEEELASACGDSTPCRFDYLKTGDRRQGKNAKSAEEVEGQTRQGLTEVIGCGYLPPPEYGMKEGSVYLLGDSVVFTCDNDYVMVGSQVRTCETSGTWSGNTTFCIERETVVEEDLLLWVLIGLAAGALMSLCFCCNLLLCCVCSKRRKIREKQKVMNSAYKLEASVISHSNGLMLEETSSHDSEQGLTNGHVITENGHVTSAEVMENGYQNAMVSADHLAASRRRSSNMSIRFAGQMSYGEEEEEGVSTAQIRNQLDIPPPVTHGYVRRTPSFDQAGPSRTRGGVRYGEDGAPDLSIRPKPRAKKNDYKDLPLSHLEPADDQFRTARIVENDDEDEIQRIKRQLRDASQRHL